VLLALGEQVADPRGADADEHLDEVGTGDREEGDIGLTGDGLGEQGFAGTRRAGEQHALGDATAEDREFLGVPEKIDDLFQFFLGLVNPGHILEGHLVLALLHQPRPVLAEGQRPALAAALHLPHEEDPDADQQQHREPGDEDGHHPRVLLGLLDGDVDPGLAQHRNDLAVVDRVDGLERLAVLQGAREDIAVDLDPGDGLAVDVGDELAVGERRETFPGFAEKVVEQDHGQANHQPHAQIFIECVQEDLRCSLLIMQ